MIRATVGILAGQGRVIFDDDYQAILDYATTQGYTLPSASQKALQNQLVVDLKDAGVWSKLDTFAVFATDGDSDFALIDWIRLSQYTAVNSPTFTTNEGYKGDGTNYILSNFEPLNDAVNYTRNDCSFGVYLSQDVTTTSAAAYGIYSSNNSGIYLNPGQSRIVVRSWNNSNGGVSTGTVTTRNGLTSTIRTTSSNVNHYRDSSFLASYSRSSTALPSNNVVLLGAASPSTVVEFADDTLHAAYLGSSLSLQEHSDFYTALNNYYTSL